MKKFDLVKPTENEGRTTDYQQGFIELTQYMEEQIANGVPYMLAPSINTNTGHLQHVLLKPAKVSSGMSGEAFDTMMVEYQEMLERDLLRLARHWCGGLSAEHARKERQEDREAWERKIREEERAKAKAELIEFMESL